jgi:hypothetical protein
VSGIAEQAVGDFRWPPLGGAGASLVDLAVWLGVPASLLAQVRGPLNFETFSGDEISVRSALQYVTVLTGVATDVEISPALGDTVTRGLRQVSVTGSPVAAQGLARRQEISMVAGDGYSTDRPFLYARRFRVDSAQPAATDYRILFGMMRQTSAELPPPGNGQWIEFDPTLGIEGWVLRVMRAAVQVQRPGILATFDNDFHTAGFLHRGIEIIPFWDGVAFSAMNDAEIQPSAGVEPFATKVFTLAASAINPQESYDWTLWGG